jgi:hypothetical protein
MHYLANVFLMALFVVSGVICLSTEGESCDNNQGTCIDVNSEECFNGDGIVKTGYCDGPSNIKCCESGVNLPAQCLGDGPSLIANSYEYTLKTQGFEGHPGALVYIPSNFNAETSVGNLEMVVYIHGYENCIRNIVRSTADACNCSTGNDVRDAYNLIDQFERASVDSESSNRLFVAAEVAYDQANDDPGRWAEAGVFRSFLDELLVEKLSSVFGSDYSYSVSDVSRVRIFSHSGGYYVIGNMAAIGGMGAKVMELCLLDSLYADFQHFDDFVTSNLVSFGTATTSQYRFSSVYTIDGGTYNNNQAMAARAKGWVTSADCEDIYQLDNDSSQELSATQLLDYSLLFKYTNLTHNDIPRNYFYDFLLTAL